MGYNLIRPANPAKRALTADVGPEVKAFLARDGWAILRGFEVDMQSFSDLVAGLCGRITFDPAREYTAANTQMVDAGLGPIGLHIENGNTPKCPDVVAFFARRAAFEGSQTTICDGVQVLGAFDDRLKQRWSQRMTVTRTLPEVLWKRYPANEHPALSSPDQVRYEHVLQFKGAIPNQDFVLNDDGSLVYSLTFEPVRKSNLAEVTGFAAAVLGSSHNYQPPRYTFADGSKVTPDEIEALRAIAEPFTTEINWQDGDVAVLDNTRILHGRRAIKDPTRELYIGMGTL
ncbi:MAG: TauD/TfdA family dioxygenase [Pseudorhodobacter sp.]|nr:TauD/TfdA family dioxygenase [Pseudorhodobacter sp.]